ncbi:hypothetical protein BX616_004060, partial [Lobosporangium transversale]
MRYRWVCGKILPKMHYGLMLQDHNVRILARQGRKLLETLAFKLTAVGDLEYFILTRSFPMLYIQCPMSFVLMSFALMSFELYPVHYGQKRSTKIFMSSKQLIIRFCIRKRWLRGSFALGDKRK